MRYSFANSLSGLATSYASASTSDTDSFTFTDNGSYTVFGRIFDKDDGFTDYSSIVVVNNVAPTATIANNGPVNEGSPVTVSLTNAVDPSSSDQLAGLRYSFANSLSDLAATYATASTNSLASFVFTRSGNYTVYGRIIDKDGGYTDYSTTITVNAITPVDVTSLVSFRYYGAQYNARTKTYSFYGTVTNTSSQTISGPIQLGWQNIAPTTAQAVRNDGTWANGTPYFDLSNFLGSDRVLLPGETSQPRTFGIKVVAPGAYSFTSRLLGVLSAMRVYLCQCRNSRRCLQLGQKKIFSL